MNPALRVTGFQFSRASESDQRRGLLGFARVTVNHALVLDGLALRRTSLNRLAWSYPGRRDARGDRHPYALPLGDEKALFERQLFDALEFKSEGVST